MSLLVNLKIVTCFNLFHIQVTVYKDTIIYKDKSLGVVCLHVLPKCLEL